MSTASDLRTFIAARLQDFDSSISVESGAAVHSAVIEPIVRRFAVDPLGVDLEKFIVATLKERLPDLSITEPGSALRDLLLKPLLLILEPFRREIEFLRTQQSVDNIEILTDDELDALLTNIFAVRNFGEFSLGTVQIFFNNPRAFGVDASIIFSTADGVTFIPQEPKTYASNDFRRSGNLYYVTVPVRSQEASAAANVERNTITQVAGLSGVVRVSNPAALTFGNTRESNSDFVRRANRSLSERSLNTHRGIETALLERFAQQIVSVRVIGFGQPEMQRDVLRAEVIAPEASLPGALTAVISKFTAEKVVTVPGASALIIPFTNLLRIEGPLSTADRAAIVNAKFLRVQKGGDTYQTRLLSRLREVAKVEEDGNDLLVQLADFELFPSVDFGEATSTSTVRSAPSTTLLGLNTRPVQGSTYSLIRTESGVDYVVGAQLPFTDVLDAGGLVGCPTAIATNRDFIFLAASKSYYTFDSKRYAAAYTMFPIMQYNLGRQLRIGRRDGYLLSANRLAEQSADFSYDPKDGVLGVHETVNIIDFGAPDYTSDDKFDGETVSLNTSPGVCIALVDDDWETFTPIVADASTLKNCIVTLADSQRDWSSRGVRVGQFIVLTVYNSDFDGVRTNISGAAGLGWQGWGRIVAVPSAWTLHVVGVDAPSLTLSPERSSYGDFDSDTGTFPAPQYRAAWTVFENGTDLYSADGSRWLSYDEFAFAPAAVSRLYSFNDGILPSAPAIAGFEEYGPQDDSEYSLNIPYGVQLAADAGHPAVNTETHAIWLRLNKPFNAVDADLGMSPAEACMTTQFVRLDRDNGGEDSAQDLYPLARYQQYETVVLPSGNSTALRVPVSLPYVEGSARVLAPFAQIADGVVDVDISDGDANVKGTPGFLVPYPLDGEADSAFIAFFGENVTRTAAYTLGLSGVPGGVPFPGVFKGAQPIANDTVHVGGMTDVYVQPTTTTNETTAPIQLTSADLLDGADVVLNAEDGVLNPDTPAVFYSQSLLSYLEGLYVGNSGTTQLVNDLVVQLLGAPTNVTPTVFRILHTDETLGGVRFEGQFAGLSGALAGLRFRVQRAVTTRLDSPEFVLQQGTALALTEGSFTARIPDGVTFTNDPATSALYLDVPSGDARGTYRIASRSANSLQLATVSPVTVAGQPFRVIRKQPAYVQRPFTRISVVRLSAGDSSGVEVPYRHPIDISAGSFTGFNNDPITDGVTEPGTLSSDGIALATFTVTDADWVSLGVITYDVLVLAGRPAATRYFYVTAVSGDTLVLDRVIDAGTYSDLTYSLGHPAIGAAEMTFLRPTFVEFTQDTVVSFTQPTGAVARYRPSPAESATIFESAYNTFTATVAAESAVGVLTTSDSTLLKSGIEVGDLVTLKTYVLRSSGTFAEDEAFSIAGRTLRFEISGNTYSVLFSSTALLTVNNVVDNLNRQVGDLLYARVQDDYLELHSGNPLKILDTGSAGLLDTLKLRLSEPANYAPEEALRDYQLTSIDYDGDTGVSTLRLEVYVSSGDNLPATALAALTGKRVFLRVYRRGVQRVYPADMVADVNGMYRASVLLTSMDAYTGQAVAPKQQMTAEGYSSYGYELRVVNNNYSYGAGEELSINCSPWMIDEAATDITSTIPLVGAMVSVEYDYAAVVSQIQASMLQPAMRVVCNNPLVRTFFPAFPVFTLSIAGGPTDSEILSETMAFVHRLYPNKPFEVFPLLKQLARRGVTGMTLPQEVGFLYYDEDRNPRILRSDNVVALDPRAHVVGDDAHVAIRRK